jgi:hypothetical protein
VKIRLLDRDPEFAGRCLNDPNSQLHSVAWQWPALALQGLADMPTADHQDVAVRFAPKIDAATDPADFGKLGLPRGPVYGTPMQVACLAWYREGSPLYPPFVGWLAHRLQSADLGPVVAGGTAAVVVPIAADAQLWKVTHRPLGVLAQAHKSSGCLAVWAEIGGRGGITVPFVEPAPALLAAATVASVRSLTEFLHDLRFDPDHDPPIGQAALQVSMFPHPLTPREPAWTPIDLPAEPWCWPGSVRLLAGGLEGQGPVCFVTGQGVSIADATRSAVQRAHALAIPDKQFRLDGAPDAGWQEKILRRRGWL